jgi:hypothetical protein
MSNLDENTQIAKVIRSKFIAIFEKYFIVVRYNEMLKQMDEFKNHQKLKKEDIENRKLVIDTLNKMRKQIMKHEVGGITMFIYGDDTN